MSKGSNPRPIEIPLDDFRSNWEKTFGKTKPLPLKPDNKSNDSEVLPKTK